MLASLVPLAHVKSVNRSVEFYIWAWLQSGGAHLMLGQAGEPVEPEKQAVLFYVYCEDVVGFRNRLIESGVDAGPIAHPFYAPGGEFRVTDPDGYVLMVTHV